MTHVKTPEVKIVIEESDGNAQQVGTPQGKWLQFPQPLAQCVCTSECT